MYFYLKDLTPTQQIGALFVLVFGLLLCASITSFALSIREFTDEAKAEQRKRTLHSLDGILRSSWVVVLVFWLGWVMGNTVALGLFACISFLALREFLTLSPIRRADHRSLVLSFFVVLPLQYWLVGSQHFEMFGVFIPVYVFLALPFASALGNDPQRFLERNAKLQWGIMVCVYGLSHVPGILLLQFPGYNHRSAFLVFFLVIVVQVCMVTQHLAARYWPRPAVAPAISSSFHWRSAALGIAVGSVFGAALAGITPWVPGTAFAFSFIACLAGCMGHFVMKALKRDHGRNVRVGYDNGPSMVANATDTANAAASSTPPTPAPQPRSIVVTGAAGLLDRVDALCFAAPVFFHSARWYFHI